MLATDMIDEIDAHGFEDIPVATKVVALNDAIRDICQLEAWPFLETDTELTYDGVTATTTDWPLDTFRAMISMMLNGRIHLRHLRLDQVDRFFGPRVDIVGPPLVFYFQNREMRLAPIPRSSDTVKMRYLLAPIDLEVGEDDGIDGDVILPPELHMAAVYGALVNLFMHDDDVEMSDKMEKRRDIRIGRARDGIWRPQYDSTELIEITDEY